MNYPSEKDDWEKLRKTIKQSFLMCYTLKNGYMPFLCFKT